MRTLGDGDRLWRVDVVLRGGRSSSDEEAILDQVRGRLGPDDGRAAPFGDLETTSSFDAHPPEGSLGVSCWVRADGPGAAVEDAWRAVAEAASSVLGTEADLWDLRLVPRSAIVDREHVGTKLFSADRRPRGGPGTL